MAHARLSASAAHRWMECAGSVMLSAPLPNRSSIHAATGTLAHDIAARCLTDARATPQMCLGKTTEGDGHILVCDQEMVDGVQFYLDTLDADVRKGDQTFVEVDLTPALQKIDLDLGGTADFVRWREKDRSLRVVDLKYGAGKVVEPTENKQLMIYALGALLTIGKPAKEVTVTIVQPRIDHEDGRVRNWTFPAKDLLSFAADVEAFATRTRLPNAPLAAGEWCGFCPARHLCPELEKQEHALTASQFGEATHLVNYDPVALAKALDAIPLVEARIKAIREFAYEEAERGNPPPGYKIVAKRPVRKWINEGAVIDWCTAKAIDAFEDPKVKSPAALEKELSKEQKKEMAQYVESVSSGHTLVPVTDKRPAVRARITADDFTAIPSDQLLEVKPK